MAFHASKFLKRVQHSIDDMTWKDIAVLKVDVIFFVLLVVHFWPELAQSHWGWYLVAVIACEAYLFQKLQAWKRFTDKKKKHKKTSSTDKSDKKSD